MCCHFSSKQQAQPIKFLPLGWYFYFLHDVSDDSAHPDLQGLRICRGKRVFKSLHTVLKTIKLPDIEQQHALKSFYVETLGVSARSEITHELIGADYAVQWISLQGQVLTLFGKIRICQVDNNCNNFFTIVYSEASRKQVQAASHSYLEIPCFTDGILENWAWSGHFLYKKLVAIPQQVHAPLTPSRNMFFPSWVVPWSRQVLSTRNGSQEDCILIEYQGVQLKLDVLNSRIDDAGSGVFVSATKLVDIPNLNYFHLDAGQMLDLGHYARKCSSDETLYCTFVINASC
jgi:hypothetical protein